MAPEPYAVPDVPVDEKGKPKLPPAPDLADELACLTWATACLWLDPAHPIMAAEHVGARGGRGVVVLHRLGASRLEFDPASILAHGGKLAEALIFSRGPTDPTPHPWNTAQAQKIATVVIRCCQAEAERTLAEEARHLIASLVQTSEAECGLTSHGDSVESYNAVRAMAPILDELGRPTRRRFLIDRDTGEYVIRVVDLEHVARQAHGSLRRGWLDGALGQYGWERIFLDGHSASTTAGRAEAERGHASCSAYRGHLTRIEAP